MRSIEKGRADLLEIFEAAVEAVGGRRAVSDHLQAAPLEGEWSLVAVGKAAEAMARGAEEVLGERLLDGLVITKWGHLDPQWLAGSRFQGIESSHPVPDGASLEAGRRMVNYLEELPEERQLLFLISGGTSSLVELLPAGVEGEQLARLNDWLLSSGLSITAINRIRKRISLVKGGGLLRWLGQRRVVGLLISDVPGDDPAVIGSGLLVAGEREESV
ncbi:MAG: glycerate-2-kinase family protein, partial [Sedimenticola sp.]